MNNTDFVWYDTDLVKKSEQKPLFLDKRSLYLQLHRSDYIGTRRTRITSKYNTNYPNLLMVHRLLFRYRQTRYLYTHFDSWIDLYQSVISTFMYTSLDFYILCQ